MMNGLDFETCVDYEENDMFHNEKTNFLVNAPMEMALATVMKNFDFSQWYHMMKSNKETENATLTDAFFIHTKEEFLKLPFERVFMRLEGCSPKDISSSCIFEVSEEGWNEFQFAITNSQRCNAFQERNKLVSGCENHTIIARPIANILKEVRCIVIDQQPHYLIDDDAQGWAFIKGTDFIPWNDDMIGPIKKLCSSISKVAPWDNFTLDLALINHETNEWKVSIGLEFS